MVEHLERFLLELGAGFAFVGRQVHFDVDEEDYYIDLLFDPLRLNEQKESKGALTPSIP